MSRHGRRGHHPHPGPVVRPRPAAPAQDRNGTAHDAGVPRIDGYRPRPDSPAAPELPRAVAAPAPAPAADAHGAPSAAIPPDRRPEMAATAPRPQAAPGSPVVERHPPGDELRGPTCTTAQLRRFIKSRPWIPMHELRRRFGIYGGDDDVTPVRVNGTMLFIGLPAPEGRLMAELLAGGDVGYELSLDPGAPIVVGVYPMRPVSRG